MKFAPDKVGVTFYYQNCEKLNIDSIDTPLSVVYDKIIKGLVKQFVLVYDDNKNVYNTEGSVKITDKDLVNGHFPIKFNHVGKDFDCSGCKNLEDLTNGPNEVSGDYNCSNCDKLTSLKDITTNIGGNINCSGCTSLKEFGVEFETVGNIDCSKCNLTNLKGLPEVIKGTLNCSYNPLLADFTAVKRVKEGINCTGCKSLNSLKDLPQIDNYKLDCSKCSLKITISNWFRKKED